MSNKQQRDEDEGSSRPVDLEAAAERLRVALDLFESGVQLMRQNLRRRHPEWSEEEVAEALQRWLYTRPGAEHGDAVGRPGTWPREPR